MKLTLRLALFIIMVSVSTMAGLTWSLELPISSFVFHVALVSCIIYGATAASLVAAKLRPVILAKFSVFIIWSLLSLFLTIDYSLFYISYSNWGLPMHISMVLSQLNQLPYIIRGLPLNEYIVWLMIFTPLVLILLFYLITAGKIQQEQQSILELRPHRRRGKSSWAYLLAPLFVVAGLYTWPGIDYLWHKFPPRKDPIISMAFSDDVQGHIINGLGLQHAEAKRGYPENIMTERPNVILIICDALRADHLGIYGYPRPTSPVLDSLATLSNGFFHPRYFAVSSVSFTGITASLSSRELVTTNSFMLHQLLKKQGYRVDFTFSGDFTNFYNLGDYLSEGVDSYQDGNDYQQAPFAGPSSNADDRILILENLIRAPVWNGEPVFKYLHFMSTHQMGQLEEDAHTYLPDEFSVNAPESEAMINDYDNRVAQFDDFLHQALTLLDHKGYMDNTLVVITSDHGQALFEDGYAWHGRSTAMRETYIPLIIFGTGDVKIPDFQPNTISDQTDLAPTITELLGLPLPTSWEGTSIFHDTISSPIFQSQAGEYSIIQEYMNRLYQLAYRAKTGKARLSDITNPGHPEVSEAVPEAIRQRWVEALVMHYDLVQ